MTSQNKVLDADAIRMTEAVIRAHVRRTPTIEIGGAQLDLDDSLRITLKLEFMQHAGSFKARGAFANLKLRAVPEGGVAAASGGNHGAAVAYAARELGVPASIFVPNVASSTKIAQIRAYGARLEITGERYADSLAACEAWVAQHQALPVHAYNQFETLAGQGTLAMEFEEQAPDTDSLLVAVGGGGLIGGIATWYAGKALRVIGVEPAAAPTLTRALEAGRPVDAPAGGIAADSLAPLRVGELMFPIAKEHVDAVFLVSDDAIRDAQRRLWRALRIVAEPGGAAALAALTSGVYRPSRGERVGVVICGANTSAVNFDA